MLYARRSAYISQCHCHQSVGQKHFAGTAILQDQRYMDACVLTPGQCCEQILVFDLTFDDLDPAHLLQRGDLVLITRKYRDVVSAVDQLNRYMRSDKPRSAG